MYTMAGKKMDKNVDKVKTSEFIFLKKEKKGPK